LEIILPDKGGSQPGFGITHERMLMPILPNLTFEQAAAIPEVFFTAYDALLPLQVGISS